MVRVNTKQIITISQESQLKRKALGQEILKFYRVPESLQLAVGTTLSMNILVYPSSELINTADCNPLLLTFTYLNTSQRQSHPP